VERIATAAAADAALGQAAMVVLKSRKKIGGLGWAGGYTVTRLMAAPRLRRCSNRLGRLTILGTNEVFERESPIRDGPALMVRQPTEDGRRKTFFVREISHRGQSDCQYA
jgi:hypothetical protein